MNNYRSQYLYIYKSFIVQMILFQQPFQNLSYRNLRINQFIIKKINLTVNIHMSRSGSVHQIQNKTSRSNSFALKQEQVTRSNSQIQPQTHRVTSVVLTPDQLVKMKLRANLISGPTNQNRSIQLMQKSKQRVSKWPDNRNDYKKRMQQKRWKQFEAEQLERRRIDAEQEERQKQIKQKTILQANQKIYQQQQKVKALNTQLLYADAIQVRQRQIQQKLLRKQQEKVRQDHFHELIKQNVVRLQEIEQKEIQDEKKKNEIFSKNIKKQNKQFKKEYIHKIKQEMEEAALLTLRAQEAIQQQQRKRRERRQAEVANKKQSNRINQQTRKKKEEQRLREQEQFVRIQQHKKKQDKAYEIQKQREKELIQQKIRARQDHYVKQLSKTQTMMSTKASRQAQVHEKHLRQLREKEAEKQRKKAQELAKLKKQFDYSIKLQVERKNEEKSTQEARKKQFDAVWKKQLDELAKKEQDEIQFARVQNLKHKEFVKTQMLEKQKLRDERYKEELEIAQNQKKQIELQDGQFKSYAQKCIKEWSENGKTVYPMLRHLATWKQN